METDRYWFELRCVGYGLMRYRHSLHFAFRIFPLQFLRFLSIGNSIDTGSEWKESIVFETTTSTDRNPNKWWKNIRSQTHTLSLFLSLSVSSRISVLRICFVWFVFMSLCSVFTGGKQKKIHIWECTFTNWLLAARLRPWRKLLWWKTINQHKPRGNLRQTQKQRWEWCFPFHCKFWRSTHWTGQTTRLNTTDKIKWWFTANEMRLISFIVSYCVCDRSLAEFMNICIC